jgi:trehalose 6-phosphate synthase/phosphatase
MGRLIVVSTRLPYSIDRGGGAPVLRENSGGLVSALKSYFEKQNISIKKFAEKIWIGSADFPSHEWASISAPVSDVIIEPIFVGQGLYDKYYNEFSNTILWPLFHYSTSFTKFEKDSFEAYIQVNKLFSEKIMSIAKENDTIWIHDYHLMLVPYMLRNKNPQLTIGFFLHIPFPSYEIFRTLPHAWKTSLLNGILGADLIGFQTHNYLNHFLQSSKMILKVEEQFNAIQYKNRYIKADLFPVGIDYEKFKKISGDKDIIKRKELLQKKTGEKKIIFSVDRIHYSTGLMYRLEAYERFLNQYPEWVEQVIFIFNIMPSHEAIHAYIERRREIEERIGSLNGRFSTMTWQPIIYLYNNLSFAELCALYQVADVALITPLRDGMNLLAKEFVACRALQNGVLILSELIGAASELNEALLVNPIDAEETAEAINTALLMPPNEQSQRMISMQKKLKDYDVVKWVDDFLEQLYKAKDEQQKQSIKLLTQPKIEKILQQYDQASKRCILLDYDGTLSPFTQLPSDAEPGQDLIKLLDVLCGDIQNEIVIISGRDPDTMDKWLGNLPLHLVAEHGAFIKLKSNGWQQEVIQQPTWKDQVRPILQLFVTRCTGSFIEEKKNTLAWHYRNTAPDAGFSRSRELLDNLIQLTANTSLQVIDGNKVIEIRQQGLDKGITALKLVKHFKPDFILCLGDDTTDEDMFIALNKQAITIKIGSSATAAHYNISSQAEVAPFLQQLVKITNKKSNVYS